MTGDWTGDPSTTVTWAYFLVGVVRHVLRWDLLTGVIDTRPRFPPGLCEEWDVGIVV